MFSPAAEPNIWLTLLTILASLLLSAYSAYSLREKFTYRYFYINHYFPGN